jgi:NhaP-type Na+/H+ or K+/H+ antiporter
MIYGLAEIILIGFIIDWILTKFKIPGLTGLLFAGMIIGPYSLNLIAPEINLISTDLRLFALIVILLRAGFELSWKALSKIGKRAFLMSFIPCIIEISFVAAAAGYLLSLSLIESAILGSVLAAVSPAVVVPLMIRFIEEGKGSDKQIPTLVLAGASIDDTVAIVLCSAFTKIYTGNSVNILTEISKIPISIITGIFGGFIAGMIFYRLFDKFRTRDTKKVILLLTCSVFLMNFEKTVSNILPFSALIAIMAIGFITLEKREHIAHKMSSKLGKIWVFAHIFLFVLVGSEVNIKIALNTGLKGLIIILIGLSGRSIGVLLCLIGSELNFKERLFCIISYFPKATVQAAIGSLPLIAMKNSGLDILPGEIILSIAVLSIIVTAPVGSFLIEYTGKRFLNQDKIPHGDAYKAAIESN